VTAAGVASIMIVVSGAVHAVVNAVLKAGKDKMSSRALIDGFSAVLVLPVAFVVPLPHGAWQWLFGSWAVHVFYLYCLIRSFERADMMVAYPVARGTAPALAAAIAVTVFAEPITVAITAGIALVSAGVMAMGLSHRWNLRSLGWAAATGVTIALYTVIDARGVRAAPNAVSYIVWGYIFLGAGIASFFAMWRGRHFIAAARSEWRAGAAAGALSIVSYGLALWAYRMGDTPKLAALRETSILFAAIIAIVFLKERATTMRLVGVASIAGGAAVLLAESR
jgi:drug/metabolite transporter (DMT)-like permease